MKLDELWQFEPEDRTHIRIDTNEIGSVPDSSHPDVVITPLFKDAHEDVRIERWAPNTEAQMKVEGGAEILVLEGTTSESGDALKPQS